MNPGVLDAIDGHGPDGIEEDLEGTKEGLAEDRIEKDSLKGGGQISVKTIDTEGLVVG